MHRMSARQLHQQFCEGKISAQQIVSHFLARIKKYDPEIGAFLNVFADQAREEAEKLDQKKAQGEPVGRLAGLPIAIKDNIHVRGELTTCGSRFLENYRAVFDATVTQLVKKEDAIIIGKTNLDEFAMGSSNENSAFQKTANPWNLQRVPGGSSGGSSAAVAARLCPLALGSDTGGSVRQPASFCGIVGFKPSYGRVSRYGLVAFGSSLDQIGPFANSTEDISMLMEVIGRHDPHDSTSYTKHPDDYFSLLSSNIKGKKIGVPWEFLENLDPQARQCFLDSLDVMKKQGCEIIDINLNILKYAIATYYILATAEASTNLARFDGIRYGTRSSRAQSLDEIYDYSRTEGFGAEVKKRILLGTYVLSSGYQDAYYKQATKVRIKIIEEFDKAFDRCDVIATPTCPTAAFPLGAIQEPLEMYLQDIYTIGVNLAYLPALSTPCGFNLDKLPFGLQFIGQRKEDTLVCHMAHLFEKETNYCRQLPPAYST